MQLGKKVEEESWVIKTICPTEQRAVEGTHILTLKLQVCVFPKINFNVQFDMS